MKFLQQGLVLAAGAVMLNVHNVKAQDGVGAGKSIYPRKSATVTRPGTVNKRAPGPCGGEYLDVQVNIDGVRELFGLDAEVTARNWRQDFVTNSYQRFVDGECFKYDIEMDPVINVVYRSAQNDIDPKTHGKFVPIMNAVFFDVNHNNQADPGIDVPMALYMLATDPMPNDMVTVAEVFSDVSELSVRQQIEANTAEYNARAHVPRLGFVRTPTPEEMAKKQPTLAEIAKAKKINLDELSFFHTKVTIFQAFGDKGPVELGNSWRFRQDTDIPATKAQSKKQTQRDLKTFSHHLSVRADLLNHNGGHEAATTGPAGLYTYHL